MTLSARRKVADRRLQRLDALATRRDTAESMLRIRREIADLRRTGQLETSDLAVENVPALDQECERFLSTWDAERAASDERKQVRMLLRAVARCAPGYEPCEKQMGKQRRLIALIRSLLQCGLYKPASALARYAFGNPATLEAAFGLSGKRGRRAEASTAERDDSVIAALQGGASVESIAVKYDMSRSDAGRMRKAYEDLLAKIKREFETADRILSQPGAQPSDQLPPVSAPAPVSSPSNSNTASDADRIRRAADFDRRAFDVLKLRTGR